MPAPINCSTGSCQTGGKRRRSRSVRKTARKGRKVARKASRKARKSRRKSRRGGMVTAAAVERAVVPFGLMALQKRMQKKQSRKNRR